MAVNKGEQRTKRKGSPLVLCCCAMRVFGASLGSMDILYHRCFQTVLQFLSKRCGPCTVIQLKVL